MTTILDEVTALDWDIVAEEDYSADALAEQIKGVKKWLEYPNKNNESLTSIMRALLKDILEIDAGCLVKVFDFGSYDFNTLEPKSGAPVLKDRGQRSMSELYARDGASFLKETDKFGFVGGYWQYSYQIPAHPMWFNRDEISYMSRNTRSMSCYGYAPTQAILDIIKSLHYSTLYNKRFFEENSIPDGVLSILDTNPNEMRAFTDSWIREYKAQPHKFAVVNKDIKWQPFTISQRELEFLETQKWYYSMVISGFGLTPTELGLTDDVNRATSASQSELSKRKGIRPILKILEYFINKDIIPEFNIEGIRFQFIYDDPVEKTQRLNNWKLEIDMGLKTINEIRNEMGLNPVEWGDVPASMTRTSTLQSIPEEAPSVEEDVAEEETRDSETLEEADVKKGLTFSEVDRTKLERTALNLNIPLDKLVEGVSVELEHSDTVANNQETIINIAVDHLKEDSEYYTKLREVEGKKKEALKGVDDGQYYAEPNQNLPMASPPPQTEELKTQPEQVQNLLTCPRCGRNTLTAVSDFADNLSGQLRCLNCNHIVEDKALIQQYFAQTLQATPKGQATSIPRWSPKSVNDLDLSTHAYAGFDFTKAWIESKPYVESEEYKDKLKSYFKDISVAEVNKIINILSRDIIQGKTISQIAKDLEPIVKDKDRAELIARTEVIRIVNAANILSMEKAGASKAKFISGPEDGRTCDKCREMDGKIMTTKEMMNKLPLHCRCRCSAVAVFE